MISDTYIGPLIVLAIVLLAVFVYAVAAWRISARNMANLRLVADNSRDGILIQAVDGTILWCNQAFCDMTGYERQECIGRSPLEFLVLEDERLTADELVKFRFRPDDELFKQFETRENVRKDGSRFHVQIGHAFVEPSSLDRKYGRRVVTTCRDISDAVKRDRALMEAQFDMISMIQTDTLTGQFSRAYIHNWMQQRMSERSVAPFAAMAIDILDCQQISETLGYSVSDALIIHVGQTIRLAAPDDAVVARSGDDAFIVAIPRHLSLRQTLHIWNDIEAALAEPSRIAGGLKTVSISTGIAHHPGHSTNVTGFMQNLQAARAAGLRRRGRNVGYYSDSVHDRASRQTLLRQDLPTALSTNEILFEAQPIFKVAGTQLSGFELLIRWVHPALGKVPPIDFLPIAEELGLMVRIDKLAARQACALQQEFSRMGLGHIRVGFNLSSDAVSNSEFSNWFEWYCDAQNVPPERLCIEILETTVFDSDLGKDEAANQIRRLRRAGFEIYLDDFGVGFAGLAHLAGLPVTGLKIDRSLVDNVDCKNSSRVIVESILRLTEELGLVAVAEGVETDAQLRVLDTMRCGRVQGFGLARPMSTQQATQWAAEQINRAVGSGVDAKAVNEAR